MKVRSREVPVKHILLACLAAAALGYFLFQARFMILGPQVSINFPKDGSLVAASILSVEGTARNIAWISLNGRQIFTDEEGNWSEKLMVPLGTSIMTVKTRDRFGREAEETVEIYAIN